MRLFRLGVVAALVLLVHAQSRWLETRRDSGLRLREAREFFPDAALVRPGDPARGIQLVLDARGETLGCLLTTSPQADAIIGYSGPNNLLLALDAHGVVAGVKLLRSGDTPDHVDAVRREPEFLRRWIGWNPATSAPPRVAAVAGATLTSAAMAEAVEHRLTGAAASLRFPEPVTLGEARELFPSAARVGTAGARVEVWDAAGNRLGSVLRTSPVADSVVGYRGPTECLVALDVAGKTVTGVRLRRSYDTESYVDQVRDDAEYLRRFVGRGVADLAVLDFAAEKLEGVSGATQTSFAVAEGLKRRMAAELRARAGTTAWQPRPRDIGLALMVLGGLTMAFTSMRGNRAIRLVWQTLVIGGLGLLNHDLLSLALFGGWAAHGIGWQATPALVLLAVVALLVPWFTRRQVYCHQLCPHGAAQQWLGAWRRRGNPGPASARGGWWRRMEQWLTWLPGSLLVAAILALLLGVGVDPADLEPFDGWAWRTAGWASVSLAVVGLVVSVFVPQAYCRFGCPTGALLGFLRSAGSTDRWGRREWLALALLAGAAGAVAFTRALPVREPEPHTLRGRAMGTAWSVKIRDDVPEPAAVEKLVAEQLEWAESMTSHWRSNTDLTRFNQSTNLDPLPLPWPVMTLVRRAAGLSEATGGAYDVTVGPLVRLWGFGPGAVRTNPPAAVELARARAAVGWTNLGAGDGTLRKRHPDTAVDLTSLAEGWAIDQVATVLARRGFSNVLVELGGEMRAAGRWAIHIEHPDRPCVLENESIGTAGTYRQNHTTGERTVSHLIDPRTGRPVTHRTVSVSVRHAECGLADAWATALNVLGRDAGFPLAERLGLAAQFTVEDPPGTFTLSSTPAWREREAQTGRAPAGR